MNYQDELKRRREESANMAPGWQPAPGDALDGVVLAVSSRDGGYGEYPIVTVLRIVNGTVTAERLAIHGMHTVLAAQIAREDPQPNDVISVMYEGRKLNPKTGREFHAWSCYVDKRPPAELSAAGAKVAAAPDPFDEPF